MLDAAEFGAEFAPGPDIAEIIAGLVVARLSST